MNLISGIDNLFNQSGGTMTKRGNLNFHDTNY